MKTAPSPFDLLFEAARGLPDIEVEAHRDVPSLKVRGRLLACAAIHKSAEPQSLVVRMGLDERAQLLAADPDVYYVTDHYVDYPSVLVRLPRIQPDALRDLLSMASRFVSGSTGTKRRRTTRTKAR